MVNFKGFVRGFMDGASGYILAIMTWVGLMKILLPQAEADVLSLKVLIPAVFLQVVIHNVEIRINESAWNVIEIAIRCYLTGLGVLALMQDYSVIIFTDPAVQKVMWETATGLMINQIVLISISILVALIPWPKKPNNPTK